MKVLREIEEPDDRLIAGSHTGQASSLCMLLTEFKRPERTAVQCSTTDSLLTSS